MVKDLTERLRRALGAEYRLWWGRIATIEAKIGRPSGYLSRVASGEITPFRRDLGNILAALGIDDPERWMRRRVAPSLDVQAILTGLPRPARRPYPIRQLRGALRKALPRADVALGETLAEPFEPGDLSAAELSSLLASCRSAPRARTVIDWLDLLCHDDPRLAAALARKLTLACGSLDRAPLELTVRAALVWASALRLVGDWIHCGLIMQELSPYAWRIGRAVEGDLLGRLAPLLCDHLKLSEALAVVDEAQALFLRAGDAAASARTFVDRALCLYTSGRNESAVRTARAALELLPHSESRPRSAAWLVIALASEDSDCLDLAEELLSPAYTCDRLAIAHGRAQLARSLGDKERHLREARELAIRSNPFEAALTTLQLVGLLIDRGELARAAGEVREAYGLLGPLRAHSSACMALMELGRLGERLTRDAVRTAKKAVRDARMSPPAVPRRRASSR